MEEPETKRLARDIGILRDRDREFLTNLALFIAGARVSGGGEEVR
jgi:hypothetical protein